MRPINLWLAPWTMLALTALFVFSNPAQTQTPKKYPLPNPTALVTPQHPQLSAQELEQMRSELKAAMLEMETQENHSPELIARVARLETQWMAALRSAPLNQNGQEQQQTTAVAANLIANGSFESGGGSFSGWTVALPCNPNVKWSIQSGITSPTSMFSVPSPPDGTHAAMTDDGPGTGVLYQDVTIPPGTKKAVFFDLFIGNRAAAFSTPASLDCTVVPNQQFRADIMTTAAALDDVGAGVLQNLYQTMVGDPLVSGYTLVAKSLGSLTGTVRLRFAEVDNQFFFHAGVDNVQVLDEPSNDFCADATPVAFSSSGGLFMECVDTSGTVLDEPGEGSFGHRSIWYKVTVGKTGRVDVGTYGFEGRQSTNYDTTIQVRTACPPAGSVLAQNDDFNGDLRSRVSFNATAGDVYYVRVAGFAGGTGIACVRFVNQ